MQLNHTLYAKKKQNSQTWSCNVQQQKVEMRGFLFLCFTTSRFGMHHLPAAYAWIMRN